MLDFNLTNVLGTYSAVIKIISVDITVCNSKVTGCESGIFSSKGFSNFAICSPYTTRAMLFPTSIVDMNCCGCAKNSPSIRLLSVLSLRSISNRNLSAETKAISMPEKKAENATESNMAVSGSTCKYQCLFNYKETIFFTVDKIFFSFELL